jgi:hypothetical protein
MTMKLKTTIFSFLILVLLISGCARDMSKQITVEEAMDMALKEAYGDEQSIDDMKPGVTVMRNGDYQIELPIPGREPCVYLVDIKYDGSTIKKSEYCPSFN